MSNQHFQSLPAEFGVCPRCTVPILIGLAEGLWARVDIQPVRPVGEIEAIRKGRATYLLRSGKLEYREAESILADRKCAPLLITHICAQPAPPAHWDTSAAKPLPIAVPVEGIPF